MLSYDNALRSIGHGEICLGPVISVTHTTNKVRSDRLTHAHAAWFLELAALFLHSV